MTLRERAPRRRALMFGAIVVSCLVLLAVGRTEPAQEVRRGVHFAVSPIQDALAGSTRSFTQVLTAFAEIDQLRLENRALRAQVEELSQEVGQLEGLRQENAELTRALATDRKLGRQHETMLAEVIGRQATQFERVITLDRGSDAGIETGDAVLHSGGALVGTVVEVGPNHSFVRLISDTRSRVVGLDTGTRATGLLTGRLSSPLAMSEIQADDDVKVGHMVETAGIAEGRRFQSMYPKGLLIGQVIDVQHDPNTIFTTAFVEPAAKLDHLEIVLVITDHDRRLVPEPSAEAVS
jgi:rod shape-determining protein MreC